MSKAQSRSALLVILQLGILYGVILAIRKISLGVQGPMGTVLTINGLLLDGLFAAILVAATVLLVRGVGEVRLYLQPIGIGPVARYALLGAAMALALQSVSILLSWVDRGTSVEVFTGFNTWLALPGAVILALSSSVFEECVFRGIALQLLCRRFAPVAAAAVQALLFVAIHLPIGKLSIGGATTVALSGFLFALITLATRSLWTAIAAHFAYNFLSAAIFGSYLIRGWHDGMFTRNPDSTGVASSSQLLTLVPASLLTAVVIAYFYWNKQRLPNRANDGA